MITGIIEQDTFAVTPGRFYILQRGFPISIFGCGRVVACFLILSFYIFAYSQPPVNQSIYGRNAKSDVDGIYQHFTGKEGLSHRWVNDVMQDSKGYLWFSTIDGLNRYDGNEFTVFRPSDSDSTIQNDWIWWAREDVSGKLRLCSKSGLHIFDPANGQFQSFPYQTWLPLPPRTFNLLELNLKDPSLPCWMGLRDSYFPTEEIAIYKFTGDRAPEFVKTVKAPWRRWLVASSQNHLWLWSPENGYTRVALKSGTTRNFGLNGKKPWEKSPLTDLPIDLKEGKLWYPATADGEEFASVPLPAGRPWPECWHFSIDRNGRVWLHFGNNLIFRYDPKQQTLEEVGKLSFHFYASIWEDWEGTIWAGHQLGVDKIVRNKSLFQHFLSLPVQPGKEPPIGFACRNIVEHPSGAIFLEDNGGLFKIEPGATAAGKEVTMKFPGENKPAFARPKSLYADKEGMIWIPSFFQLKKFDPLSGNAWAFEDPAFPFVFVHAIEDAYGRFWLTPDAGNAVLFDKKTQGFSFPKCRTVQIDYGIATNGGKMIWAFYPKGLVKINCKTETADSIQLYQAPRDQRQLLFHEGYLWLATSRGLTKVDTSSWRQTTYHRGHGLPASFVYSMLPDGQFLWLGTAAGLCRFNIRTHEVKNFFVEDGLSHNEFNSKAVLKTRDGRFFMGGLNGVNVFRPEDLRQSSTWQPNLLWTKFSKYDGKKDSLLVLPGEQMDIPKPLVFHPSDQSFIFHFALTSYKDPRQNQFAWFMEGLDKSWRPVSNSPIAAYHYLPPGEYVLRVRATDSNGNPAANELAIQMVMLRSWWRTWWAYTLYALAILGLLLAIRSYELRRKLTAAEARRLQELDTVKSRLYTNVTHEFRTPLTVILGMAEQLSVHSPQSTVHSGQQVVVPEGTSSEGTNNWQNGLAMIKRNGRQLLHLVNQMLDLAKLESGSLPVQWVQGDVVLFLKYLLESFHSLAQDKSVALHFESSQPEFFMDYDPDMLQKITANLLSNAIKFTPPGGNVQLAVHSPQSSVDEKADQLELMVTDTGPGIPSEQLDKIFDRFYQVQDTHTRQAEGAGIGLSLTKELVKLLGGDIMVQSGMGKGTAFTVSLPVHREAPIMETPAAMEDLAPVLSRSRQTQNAEIFDAAEKPLLLIVEDNDDVVQYIAACLQGNYQIVTAGNGREGVETAIEMVPDLIISDVMMPEMDGFQLCDTLKNDERTSHIPIVLLTAKADEASRLAGLRRGADAYLAKPFNEEELHIHLEKLIELRRKLQARYSNAEYGMRNAESSDAPNSAFRTPHSIFETEDKFLKKLRDLVEKDIAVPDLDIVQAARQVAMSRSQLFRKVKALTGKSPSAFIRTVRLQKAALLLRTTDLNVSEIAYEVGFSDPAYFSNSFREEFGMAPGDFRAA